MQGTARISDHVIWFKHLEDDGLRERLGALEGGESISLETGGVIGRWVRMKPDKEGRPTAGIRPEGAMKTIWNDWFKNRKGDTIEVRQIQLADDYLKAAEPLFSEWASREDEEAFRDL